MEVNDELLKLGKFGMQSSANTKKIGAVVLDFIVSVFQPLIPAIAGAGIIKSTYPTSSLLTIYLRGYTMVFVSTFSINKVFFLTD